MPLPQSARARLTAHLSADLLQRLSPVGVAVTEPAWRYGCQTVAAHAAATQAAAFACLREPGLRDDAGLIWRAAKDLQRAAEQLARSLWALSCLTLDYALVRDPRAAEDALRRAVCDYLRSTTGSPDPVEQAAGDLQQAVERLCAASYPGSAHPLAQLLKIEPGRELDRRGKPSVSRVLAAFYLRADELEERLRPVIRGVTDQPVEVLTATEIVVGLLGSPNPFIALEASADCIDRTAHDIARGGSATRPAFRAARDRLDQAAFSLGQIAAEEARLADAGSGADIADSALNVYRRVIEGHLRPSAWFLVSLDKVRLAQAPTLTALDGVVRKAGGTLARVWDESVVVPARNAGAHEDFTWDSRRDVLVFDGGEVSVTELREATSRAQSFVAGVSLARDALPWLFRASVRAATGSPSFLASEGEAQAVRLLGTNGLLVQGVTHEKGSFRAHVERVRREDINPALQALTYGSRWLPDTEQFQVLVEGDGHPVIDVDRAALDATFAVWHDTISRFRLMPLSAFLPANWAARSHSEPPARAARNAAWIAADDALDAWFDLEGGTTTDQLDELQARLEHVEATIGALLPLVQERHRWPLERVRSHVAAVRKLRDVPGLGALSGPLVVFGPIRELQALHGLWSPVARLPTVPGS